MASESGKQGRSQPGLKGGIHRITESLTGSHGMVAAVLVGLALMGGLSALIQQGYSLAQWVAAVGDSGPTDKDIKIVTSVLPDGRDLGMPTRYLLPYGSPLPSLNYDPTTGSYCGDLQDDYLKLGPSIGASVVVSMQNTYTGSEAAGVQVSGIRVEVVDQSDPRPGVLMNCVNSGGDEPVVGSVRAVNGARMINLRLS